MRVLQNPSRRVAVLLATMLLAACGSDPVAPVDPEPQGPPIARWAGTYTGQSRFGATSGTWGNGGTYRLVVTSAGEVTLGGKPLENAMYDDHTSTLSWSRADGNSTNAEVMFRQGYSSDFYFRDLENATAGRNFTGYIQRAGEGRLDYRGVLLL